MFKLSKLTRCIRFEILFRMNEGRRTVRSFSMRKTCEFSQFDVSGLPPADNKSVRRWFQLIRNGEVVVASVTMKTMGMSNSFTYSKVFDKNIINDEIEKSREKKTEWLHRGQWTESGCCMSTLVNDIWQAIYLWCISSCLLVEPHTHKECRGIMAGRWGRVGLTVLW